MKFKALLVGLMAVSTLAIPVADAASSTAVIGSSSALLSNTSLLSIPSMHVVSATDSFAFNADLASRRDWLTVCIDVYEKANFNGPSFYNQCIYEDLCLTITDASKSERELQTIGSVRMEGSTICQVYESDNCSEGTLRETITEKNMLAWPPVIPIGSWRASLHCTRPE